MLPADHCSKTRWSPVLESCDHKNHPTSHVFQEGTCNVRIGVVEREDQARPVAVKPVLVRNQVVAVSDGGEMFTYQATPSYSIVRRAG